MLRFNIIVVLIKHYILGIIQEYSKIDDLTCSKKWKKVMKSALSAIGGNQKLMMTHG